MPGDWQPTRLTITRFRRALYEAFDEPSIGLLTTDYFAPDTFNKLAPPGPGMTFEFRLQELIDQAKMNDWFADLVAAARERRPNDTEISKIATEIGLTLSGPRLTNPTGLPLEALIQRNARFIIPATFYQRLPQLEGQVCWIKMPGGGGGTGFLVGADIVFTNHHVISPLIKGDINARDVKCIFDYRQPLGGTGLERKKPTLVGLAQHWLINSWPPSPYDGEPRGGDAAPEHIDSALLRLAEPIGELPLGGPTSDSYAQPRQWINLNANPERLTIGSQIFLLQHPGGEPLQMAVGTVKQFNDSGTRIRYDANSKPGSSGSPCLDADLQFVALHHARDPHDPPGWNQAIPLIAIKRALRDAGIVAASPQETAI